MSYILDALRKADHERSIGDVPDLEAPHWSQRRSGPVRHWVLVVIGLIILNGALLAMLFSRDDSGESSPAVSALVAETGAGVSMEPSQEIQYANVEKPRQPAGMQLEPLARPEKKVITAPRQPVPAMAKRQPVNQTATLAPPRATAAAGISKAPLTGSPAEQPPATKSVQTGGAEIPEWNELSLEFRSGFTPPRLDVHVYDEDPSRRFILVELQRFVEGDTLGNGAKLEEIMPGGIQMYYQGTRFRIDR